MIRYVIGAVSGVSLALLAAGSGQAATTARAHPGPAAAASVAYVVNENTSNSHGSLTPINTVTNKAGKPIPVGNQAWDLAITPNGHEAYVADIGTDGVTPVNLQTSKPGKLIKTGPSPYQVAIT